MSTEGVFQVNIHLKILVEQIESAVKAVECEHIVPSWKREAHAIGGNECTKMADNIAVLFVLTQFEKQLQEIVQIRENWLTERSETRAISLFNNKKLVTVYHAPEDLGMKSITTPTPLPTLAPTTTTTTNTVENISQTGEESKSEGTKEQETGQAIIAKKELVSREKSRKVEQQKKRDKKTITYRMFINGTILSNTNLESALKDKLPKAVKLQEVTDTTTLADLYCYVHNPSKIGRSGSTTIDVSVTEWADFNAEHIFFFTTNRSIATPQRPTTCSFKTVALVIYKAEGAENIKISSATELFALLEKWT